MGLYRDNGQENGNYYSILGLYTDNENKMETAGYLWVCGLGSEVKLRFVDIVDPRQPFLQNVRA